MPSGYLATDNPEGPRRRSIACFEDGYDGEPCRWIYMYIYIASFVHRPGFIVVCQLMRNYRIEGIDTLLRDYVFLFELLLLGD